MADVLTNAAIDAIAKYILGLNTQKPSLTLGLFINNFPFADDTDLDDLVECTAPGYARIPLPAAIWQGQTVNGLASYSAGQKTFAINGPGNPGQTIFGHFVLDTVSGNLWWGANWLTPWVIPPVVGQNPSVTPNWNDYECS